MKQLDWVELMIIFVRDQRFAVSAQVKQKSEHNAHTHSKQTNSLERRKIQTCWLFSNKKCGFWFHKPEEATSLFGEIFYEFLCGNFFHDPKRNL